MRCPPVSPLFPYTTLFRSGVLRELERASERLDPALALAAEDERHSLGGRGEELGSHGGAGREELAGPPRGAQHLARRPCEEGRVDRLREQCHRELRPGVRG